jgi:hypothetical protein
VGGVPEICPVPKLVPKLKIGTEFQAFGIIPKPTD